MKDRLERLIADAAACVRCGKEHLNVPKVCRCTPECTHRLGVSWASPDDGHAYRKPDIDVYWLRTWAEANPS